MAIKTDAETAAKNEQHKTAWDAETMGFGKHQFHFIDPETVNPEDYARKLEGEEQHFGEIRQYNSAFNAKHPETNVDLDWLSRIGTVFETDAEFFAGTWVVTGMPVVKAPTTFCRVKAYVGEEPMGPEVSIPCAALGCAVDEQNYFAQVKTRLVQRGKVDRDQRARLTRR